jgi:hypothetical protein
MLNASYQFLSSFGGASGFLRVGGAMHSVYRLLNPLGHRFLGVGQAVQDLAALTPSPQLGWVFPTWHRSPQDLSTPLQTPSHSLSGSYPRSVRIQHQDHLVRSGHYPPDLRFGQ